MEETNTCILDQFNIESTIIVRVLRTILYQMILTTTVYYLLSFQLYTCDAAPQLVLIRGRFLFQGASLMRRNSIASMLLYLFPESSKLNCQVIQLITVIASEADLSFLSRGNVSVFHSC